MYQEVKGLQTNLKKQKQIHQYDIMINDTFRA